MSGKATALPLVLSVRRTIAGSLAFQGRATRTEVANYLLGAALALLVLSFATALIAAYAVRALVSDGLTLLLALPVPALLVRRLHDQGRPGWLAGLAGAGFALWLARTILAAMLGTDARISFDRLTWLLDWTVILANLGIVALMIMPGQSGPNRFGPDPRQS